MNKDAQLIYEAYQPLNEGKIKSIITALDAGDSVDQILKDLKLPNSARSAVQTMHDRYYEKGEREEDNIGTAVKKVAMKAAPHLKEIGKQALAGMAHSVTDAVAKKAHSAADKVVAPSEDASSCPYSDEEFTEKSGEVESMLTKMLGGKNRRAYIAAGKCVMTGKDAGPFRDELSKREYMISGIGQEAQDEIFGAEDDEECQEVKRVHVAGKSKVPAEDYAALAGMAARAIAPQVAGAVAGSMMSDEEEDSESSFVHTLANPKTRFEPTEARIRYSRESEGIVHEAIENFIKRMFEEGIVQSETEAFRYIDSYMDQVKEGQIAGVPEENGI
jgi:hypothetical protein|tara:strand:- start:8717 stop:9709 length:993 start_codon:yes stop_codon:yes gene_type:complete